MCQRNRILAAACLASLAPLGASAATICVNPGATDGCLSSIAAALASAAPTGDTISVAAGTYHESGMLIDRSVDIVGAGVDLTVVDGSTGGVNASQSIFRFPGFTVPVTSTLSRLTVRGGARGLDAGGGNTVTVDHARFTANGPWTGAGLFNGASILNVKATLVDGNSATDNGSVAGCDWGGGSGGGLASLCGGGNNYISNSAFVGNTASRWGGGLIVNDGQTVIENTTISGNSAQFSDPGLAGSAFFMGGAFPDITLRYSTIANNSGMGPVIQADGKLKLQATLVQGNTGAACSTDANNPIASLGYNMVSDGTCLFAQAGDAINTDAHLLPLASNGVDTPTHALPATSPAVDRIPNTACSVSTDQDGVARPQNFSCDVGAYEHVWSTSELMTLLLAQLNGFGAPHGIVSTANAANVAIAYGQYGIACSALSNVSSNIQSLAMRGQFPPGPAAAIQQSAGAVRSSIGC